MQGDESFDEVDQVMVIIGTLFSDMLDHYYCSIFLDGQNDW